MECRTLDLTIISAKDLKDVQLIGKQDVYAVVSINGDENTRQKTKVDVDCGTKPKWKQTMKFTIDEAAAQQNLLTFTFHIMAHRPIVGDKQLGEIHVPVKELLDGSTGKSVYSVTMPNGKTKGSLKLSYEFGEKFFTAPHGYAAGYPPQGQYGYQPQGPDGYPPQGPSGYPGAVYQQSEPEKEESHGGGGTGFALGLGAGLVGGLVVGEIVDKVADGSDDSDEGSDD